MSKYTTQVRFIVEMNSTEGQPVSKRIEEACPRIFDFDFPLWNNDYKLTLEKKILMHYYNKEIGLETVALWKLFLEERLNLIMPYYNEMYESTVQKYDFLNDIDLTETYQADKNTVGNTKGTANGTDTSTSSIDENTTVDGTKTSKDLKSDFPQANYANLDYGTELMDTTDTDNSNSTHQATSNGTINTNTTTNTDSQSNTQDNFTRKNVGLNGSKSRAELIMLYRQTLTNIDKLIIDDLKDLFMLIY